MDEPSGTSEVIRVEVPATGEHLRLARLMVAGAASQHDASLDDIEDLRLAVGEICAHLVAVAADGARMSIEIEAGPLEVVVRAASPCRDGAPPPDELMATLLATVTDEHSAAPSGPGDPCTLWFRRAIGASRPT